MLIRSFISLRLSSDTVRISSCPPYDVISREEAGRIIEKNPQSFLRITRSDSEFPESVDQHSDKVYKRAAENLEIFLKQGVLVRELGPCLYIYQQIERNGHSQTGVVGCVSVDEYRNGTIKVHERTRPDKVEDRTRHMIKTGLHAEPVFLAFKSNARVSSLIKEETLSESLFDFTSDDGVRHILWKADAVDAFTAAFAAVPHAYIADGHHRAESAAHVPCGYFPAVLFPHDQLRILPYNRIIRRFPSGETQETLMKKVSRVFEVTETKTAAPSEAGKFCMFAGESWYLLEPGFSPHPASPVDALDVSLLSSGILRPVFGIEDERTDKNIDFVGGGVGTEELEEIVREGSAVCAFSMYPVTIEQLFAVADAGHLMPPKSTWFEPKLRSGLFVHQFR